MLPSQFLRQRFRQSRKLKKEVKCLGSLYERQTPHLSVCLHHTEATSCRYFIPQWLTRQMYRIWDNRMCRINVHRCTQELHKYSESGEKNTHHLLLLAQGQRAAEEEVSTWVRHQVNLTSPLISPPLSTVSEFRTYIKQSLTRSNSAIRQKKKNPVCSGVWSNYDRTEAYTT